MTAHQTKVASGSHKVAGPEKNASPVEMAALPFRVSTAQAVLRGLIYQLLKLHHHDSIYACIEEEFEIRGETLFSDVHLHDFWRIFENMVGKVSMTVFIIVDGLDECAETSVDFLIKNFVQLHSNPGFF
ncbi:Fc.00g037250.m01.CDS01 [Cosmosporella sp. VM-42]